MTFLIIWAISLVFTIVFVGFASRKPIEETDILDFPPSFHDMRIVRDEWDENSYC